MSPTIDLSEVDGNPDPTQKQEVLNKGNRAALRNTGVLL